MELIVSLFELGQGQATLRGRTPERTKRVDPVDEPNLFPVVCGEKTNV